MGANSSRAKCRVTPVRVVSCQSIKIQGHFMRTPSKSPEKTEEISKRLDCWKEIASYLGKGERTVKRWETDRGLPIHRVPGGGRASVYARSVELDEWLRSNEAKELDVSSDDSEEAEPADGIWTAQDALGGSAQTSPSALEPSAKWLIPRGRWFLAFCGLLLAGIVGMAVYAVALRTPRMPVSLLSLFKQHAPRSDRPTSTAFSDTEKTVAHDFYLRGRYEWNQRTPDSLHRALDCFTQSVVHDPGNAQAYVGLADTYILLREFTTMPENEAYVRAIAAARKAVELDDSLAEAHRALAFAETYGNWDLVNGEREFRRAIELNPKDPIAHLWHANAMKDQGRFREGLEEINKAQELDPSSHAILADKGGLLYSAGKQEEGIDLLKEVERSDPEFRSPHYHLMRIGFELRDYSIYLIEGEKAARSMDDPVLKETIASARMGYMREGERGLLQAVYTVQKKQYSAGNIQGVPLAETCVRMGRKQEALQLLEEDYRRHSAIFLWCLSSPTLLTLKDEPRYKTLLKKINSPPWLENADPSTPEAADHSPVRASSEPH
jgi:tetratricopeptide (TPR) repeat protein